jgi:hypothetical protein
MVRGLSRVSKGRPETREDTLKMAREKGQAIRLPEDGRSDIQT